MVGSLTTTLGAIRASPRASSTMALHSVETTSRLTGPSTIEQISPATSSKGRPSFEIRDGLVVTPSSTPRATASRISSTFAVSRKNFITILRQISWRTPS